MRRIPAAAALALVAVGGGGGVAHAGRSPFGWTYYTEVNPVRMVELETWISEENQKGDANTDKTLIWWAPTVGLTDHLELAIPIELAAESAGGGAGIDTQLIRWGGELRYRFDPPDPVEAGRFTTLVRAGIKRAVTARAAFRAEADVVLGFEHERVTVGVDAGLIVDHAPGTTETELVPGLGIGIRAVGDLRVGAEMYGEFVSEDGGVDWLVVGPSASFTHGRFWIATTYAIGVFGIRTAPRVKFGISF